MFSQVPSIESNVPRVRGVYRVSFFLLLSNDSTYSPVPGDQGGPILLRLMDFFGGRLMHNLE
jgi:hypothetical protein